VKKDIEASAVDGYLALRHISDIKQTQVCRVTCPIFAAPVTYRVHKCFRNR